MRIDAEKIAGSLVDFSHQFRGDEFSIARRQPFKPLHKRARIRSRIRLLFLIVERSVVVAPHNPWLSATTGTGASHLTPKVSSDRPNGIPGQITTE